MTHASCVVLAPAEPAALAHLMTLTVMAPRLLASNAFFRLHSSYRMQPMAQMSVFPSYERPCKSRCWRRRRWLHVQVAVPKPWMFKVCRKQSSNLLPVLTVTSSVPAACCFLDRLSVSTSSIALCFGSEGSPGHTPSSRGDTETVSNHDSWLSLQPQDRASHSEGTLAAADAAHL